jgi:TP901 family phage tail tape measure protein
MALEKIGVEATIQGLSSFRRGIGQIDDDVRGFGRSADGIVPGLNRMGDSLLNIGGIAAGAVVAGLAAATGAAVAFAGSGIKAAIDMEDQMGNIAAVMNTTKEEIQPLSDLIIDLGLDPGLKVDATEAANAIELLARNGLTMTEIIDGAAKATVLLANATGAEFGTAADIATDAMAIFNIEGKDMIGVVDGITSVTTNSKFTIDDYSLALRNGAPAADQFGVSLKDFNTVIAATADEMGSGIRS